MSSSDKGFWENQLLPGFTGTIVYHGIITMSLIVELIEENPCSVCHVLCKEVAICRRLVVGKTFMEKTSVYMPIVAPARMCKSCISRQISLTRFSCVGIRPSAIDVLDYINSMFDKVCTIIFSETTGKEISGNEFIKLYMQKLHGCAPNIKRKISKIDNICFFCKKPDAKAVCSVCQYVRYCDEKCSHAHWKRQHKHECADYSRSSVFLTPFEVVK